MSIKRVEISEETINLLKKHDDELMTHPRSTTALASAIARLAKEVDDCQDKKVEVDRISDNLIEEMIRFGLIESKEMFMHDAISAFLESKKDELRKCIDAHTRKLGL